jgi:hypothetical protein
MKEIDTHPEARPDVPCRRGFLAVFPIVILGFCCGAAMNAEADTIVTPSVAPQNERLLPHEDIFRTACRSSFSELEAAQGWKLGTEIITNDDRWGKIYRADFEIFGKDVRPFVNRIVCWRTTKGEIVNMISIAQRVLPLHAASFRD